MLLRVEFIYSTIYYANDGVYANVVGGDGNDSGVHILRLVAAMSIFASVYIRIQYNCYIILICILI